MAGERHAERAAPCRPAQCDCDQQIDRRIFQKIDAVREQGHRPDRGRDGELDAEVAEVQDGNDPDTGAAPLHRCVWVAYPAFFPEAAQIATASLPP